MTIEIRQLVIRAVVESRPEGVARPVQHAGGSPAPAPTPHESDATIRREERDELVATCVREVLRELRKGRER